MLIAISESRRPRRNSVRYPVNAGYRNYDAPIFAIPGNHDGAVFKGETAGSLDAFRANFCAEQPGHSPDSQGAVRTTMDQPGVYSLSAITHAAGVKKEAAQTVLFSTRNTSMPAMVRVPVR